MTEDATPGGPVSRWIGRLRSVDYRALAMALAVGTGGGALFAWAQMPLAWMIGAMLFTTAASLAGDRLPVPRLAVPKGLRAFMVMVLGIMLGSRFEPEILDHLDRWAISLALLPVYILLCIGIGLVYLRRVARYDAVTAFFTATPGGFNEMVMVGGSLGGDERRIALSHSLRIMLVVFTVPVWFQLLGAYAAGDRAPLGPPLGALAPLDLVLLAACAIGAPIARVLKIPASALIGPMVLSAAIHLAGLTAGSPPGILIAAAQVVVGAAIGCRFSGIGLAVVAKVALVAAGLTALLLAAAVVFSWVLHFATGLPTAELILAYAPGGLAEMSLVALALGVDAAFVSTHHIVRIFLIVTFAPLAFALGSRLAGRPRQAPGED